MKIGVIGAGRFGRLHVQVLQQLPGVEVTAIADKNIEAAKEAADWYGIPVTYDNGEALIKDENAEAIDVVSDESTHGRFAILALQENKHVFVEKPLAVTYKEASAIEQEAEGRNCAVMAGHICRFSLPYITMKRQVEKGMLGSLRSLRLARDFNRTWFETFGHRVHPVYESGIHDLDLLIWFAGTKWKSIQAIQQYSLSYYVEPDSFASLIEFDNGIYAVLQSSWLLPDQAPQTIVDSLELNGTIRAELELIGSSGSARFNGAKQGTEIWTNERVFHPDNTLWPHTGSQVSGAIKEELSYFCDVAAYNKKQEWIPLHEAVVSLEMAEAIEVAAKTGERVVKSNVRL
ncbi:Gfo/Idh/MocA family protein [Salibacterium aidingense]|uniref:Gfo/Idh/MocA family protein n=1 Tax=Salibacterium aidingense TaxID=384933 RepID=UPI003BC86EF9